MKAEIILTDNNINIDLNEPTIDVSTEDGFSVTIIGGVGPQGGRGPEGPKGEKGDDYVLTEEDKDDIAEMAAEKVDLSDYVKNTDYATSSAAGIVKVAGLGVKMSNGELVLAPASARQIKQGVGDTAPIIAAKEHEAVFFGLARAAGDESQKASDNAVGVFTDAAKVAIQAMLGVPSVSDIPVVPIVDVHIDGSSILSDGIAEIPVATSSKLGVVKAGNGLYMQGGAIHLNAAPEFILKRGDVTTAPVVSSNQHIGVFYGLTKAAGVDMAASSNPIGAYTDEAKAAIREMIGATALEDIPQAPVRDVQINGVSILGENGNANIPLADDSNPGVVKVPGDRGLSMTTAGNISLVPAPSSLIKAGEQNYYPIVPKKQHEAVFYGLAKAAGADEKESELPGGQYTEGAKAAIKVMLGITDPSVTDVQINGMSIVADGAANIPSANTNTLGVVKT